MSELVTNVTFDREQAFLLYATFCGDVERTAHSLNVRPIDILRAVDECGWNEKLKNILALKRSARPGDIERGINRALNFVLAHKYRLVLERIVSKLSAMTNAELDSYVFEGQTKEGIRVDKLTTRALADLASGLEKMSAMSYQALGDTAPERSKREDVAGDGDSSGAIHAAIAKAMAEVRDGTSTRAQLLDAQIANGQTRLVPAPEVIVHPNDNDEH